jgi:hypothetical protein
LIKPAEDKVAAARRFNTADSLPLFSESGQASIETIKANAGLSKEFDLKAALDVVWYDQLRDVHRHRRLTKKQKERSAAKLLTKVNMLRTQLCGKKNSGGMSDEEMAFLVGLESSEIFEPALLNEAAKSKARRESHSFANIFSRISKLLRELSWLADLCTRAQARQFSDGRRPLTRRDELVCSLRLIYVSGLHPKKASRLGKDTLGVYRGKFLDFVQACFPILGERAPPNSTLGPMISKALKALKSRPYKRALLERIGIKN